MLNFKEYIQKIEEHVQGFLDVPHNHDTNDIGLPVVRREGRIVILDQAGSLSHKKLKSPVFVQLEDGTKLYLTRHEFDRIKGERPERGKMLSVTFQRHRIDSTEQPSQVESITCRS